VKPNRILLDDLSFVSYKSSLNKKCFDIRPTDILITMTGNRKDGGADSWVGKVALFNHAGRYLLNQRVSAIRVKDNSLVDNVYLSYLLSGWDAQLYFVNHSNSSGGQANISPDIVYNYAVSLPPLSVQYKISSILKSLDDKIEVNRKINENLEQQAQALFKSWFVDFEPFKNGEFVESELGMIPKGWRVGTFLDNIKVMPGGTPSTSRSEYWDDGTIPFFSPKDVNGVYCFETEKSITELGLNNCSSNLYPKDTLFITARGTVGKLTLAGVPMAMNQSNYALVAREGVGKYYLYLITQTLVSVLLKKANGAVFSAITTRDFNEPTLMPTHNDLKNFELLVTPIFKKIFQTSVESRRLAELRDTLLPKLMSGELKVGDVD
jgi:type I restriction enzyme S subunit